jgi:hypothetical protein
VNNVADLALIGALASVWLAAGLLADGLPAVPTARRLHRRARTLSTLVGFGAAVFVAVPVVAAATPGPATAPAAALLPSVPALVVLASTLRRLTWLRRGAAAVAAGPLTPAPPALTAAAAHPLIATPLQVTGLAAVVAVPVAAGLVALPGASMADLAITVVALVVVAIGARHGLRHSRLAERAVRIRAAVRSS